MTSSLPPMRVRYQGRSRRSDMTSRDACRSDIVSKSGTTRNGSAIRRLLLQELDRKHITWLTGHRNHVSPERIPRQGREHAERVQDLLDLIRGGHVLGNEGSLRAKLGDEKLLTLAPRPSRCTLRARGVESARRGPACDGRPLGECRVAPCASRSSGPGESDREVGPLRRHAARSLRESCV